MKRKFARPNADRPNLNDHISITSRRSGDIHSHRQCIGIKHIVGIESMTRTRHYFDSFLDAYEWVNRFSEELEAQGWTRRYGR